MNRKKRSFLKNPCNWYFFLWCLCELKGTLYEPGSAISQGLMLILMLISAKEVLVYYQKYSKYYEKSYKFFKCITMLMMMYTFYGVLLFITDGFVNQVGPTYYYLQSYYISFFPIFTCYVYTKRGLLTLENFRFWVIIFVVVGVCQYFYAQITALNRMIEKGKNRDEVTNNAGYIMLALVPCMMVYKKKPILMFAGLAICVVFVVISMKRGAIMICAVSMTLIVYRQIKSSGKSLKALNMLLVLIGLLVLWYFLNKMIESNDYFNARIQQTLEGDTSERDVIYKNLLDVWINDFSVIGKLFGVGGMGTVKVVGMYAHNDWLEILFDNGVLGVLLFINYWKGLYRTAQNKRFTTDSRFCLLLILVIYGTKTFFSMSIGGMSIFVTSIFGFALADGFSDELANNKRSLYEI